jgi:hypothetical protein
MVGIAFTFTTSTELRGASLGGGVVVEVLLFWC